MDFQMPGEELMRRAGAVVLCLLTCMPTALAGDLHDIVGEEFRLEEFLAGVDRPPAVLIEFRVFARTDGSSRAWARDAAGRVMPTTTQRVVSESRLLVRSGEIKYLRFGGATKYFTFHPFSQHRVRVARGYHGIGGLLTIRPLARTRHGWYTELVLDPADAPPGVPRFTGGGRSLRMLGRTPEHYELPPTTDGVRLIVEFFAQEMTGGADAAANSPARTTNAEHANRQRRVRHE